MRNIDRRAGIFDTIVARGYSLARNHSAVLSHRLALVLLSVFWLAPGVVPLHGRQHKKHEEYGQSFSTEIPAPEKEVLEAVAAVVDDGIIQGSFEYNKDKYIDHANAAESSAVFPAWKDPGEVFYKVRSKVL